MDCSLILQTDAMPPNFAKKLSLVVTKPLKFAKVFSPESIRYPLPLHLHVNVGYLIDPNATTAAWLTAFEGCSRLRSCPKLMGSEFTSAIQKKRENKKMCFTDEYGTIFTCTLQIYGSIRKSITIVNFPGKVVTGKMITEIVGAEMSTNAPSTHRLFRLSAFLPS